MDACSLDMLHNARNQDIRAVADRINFQFFTLQILVHQNRVVLLISVNDRHKLFNLLVGQCDLHALSAQHIGRTHQHRIAQPVRHGLGILRGIYRTPGCSRNPGFLQNLVKKLSVLGSVHILSLRSQNGHSHLHQALCQLDRRLSAELHDRSVRFLHIHDILHILRCQRLEI